MRGKVAKVLRKISKVAFSKWLKNNPSASLDEEHQKKALKKYNRMIKRVWKHTPRPNRNKLKTILSRH